MQVLHHSLSRFYFYIIPAHKNYRLSLKLNNLSLCSSRSISTKSCSLDLQARELFLIQAKLKTSKWFVATYPLFGVSKITFLTFSCFKDLELNIGSHKLFLSSVHADREFVFIGFDSVVGTVELTDTTPKLRCLLTTFCGWSDAFEVWGFGGCCIMDLLKISMRLGFADNLKTFLKIFTHPVWIIRCLLCEVFIRNAWGNTIDQRNIPLIRVGKVLALKTTKRTSCVKKPNISNIEIMQVTWALTWNLLRLARMDCFWKSVKTLSDEGGFFSCLK